MSIARKTTEQDGCTCNDHQSKDLVGMSHNQGIRDSLERSSTEISWQANDTRTKTFPNPPRTTFAI